MVAAGATAKIFPSGMNYYVNRLVTGPPFKGNEEMQYEGVRLITFKDWPNWGSVWPTVLAKAGFYYTGTVDQVACCCCSGRLKTWEAGDSPMIEHRRFFPQCRFVTGRDTKNVLLGDTTESPQVPSGGQNNQTRNTHAPSNFLRSLARYAGASVAGNDRPSSSLTVNAQVQQQAPQRGHYESLSGISRTDGPAGRQQSRRMLGGGTPLLTDQSFILEQLQGMKLESRRLDSFRDWPISVNICKENLAKAGLYYLGIADRVKCAFCNGTLRNWEPGDEPMVEHRKFFPNCAFLTDARVAGNMTIEEETANNQHASQNAITNTTPTSELGIVTETPIHQNYAIEADRLATFRQWPQDSPLSPEALASAGFFYTRFGDNVKCFFCNGGLRNWEMGDDAWTEHARWFPRCNYVRTVKCQDFILRTQTTYTGQDVTIPTSNTAARSIQASSTVGRYPVEPRAVRARTDTSMVQMVLEMGFSRDLLHRVIENHLATVGDDFPNVHSLLEAVFVAEETSTSLTSSLPQQSSTATSTAAEPAASSGTEVRSGAAAEPADDTSGPVAMMSLLTSLSPHVEVHDQSQELSEHVSETESSAVEETAAFQVRCKICMDGEALALFMLCRHVYCCLHCAARLEHCPVCREKICLTYRIQS